MGLKYYVDKNDTPVTNLLRKASMKTENHLMDINDSSWKDCPDTGRSTGAYIIFYQCGTIDHGTLPTTDSVDFELKPNAKQIFS